jgi:hypothetical protein
MAKKKNKLKRVSLFTIFRGDGFGFLSEYSGAILLITIFTIFFIGNRYSCILKIRQIDRLKKELSEAKLDARYHAVELIRHSRRAELEERLLRQGAALGTAKEPPYILYK